MKHSGGESKFGAFLPLGALVIFIILKVRWIKKCTSNKDKLFDTLKRGWKALHQDPAMNLVHSVPRRIRAVTKRSYKILVELRGYRRTKVFKLIITYWNCKYVCKRQLFLRRIRLYFKLLFFFISCLLATDLRSCKVGTRAQSKQKNAPKMYSILIKV